MSLGLRADPSNTSAVISVAGTDQVVITNAGNVVATTFTGALTGNATTATALFTATGTAPVYGVRAWVNFNGLNNTSNVVDASNTNRFIYASGNVTNVLKNSTGSYTIYFTTPMPDINFTIMGGPVRYALSGTGRTTTALPNIPVSSWAPDNVTISAQDFSGTATDSAQIHVAIIR
jgi:hypothetical protein